MSDARTEALERLYERVKEELTHVAWLFDGADELVRAVDEASNAPKETRLRGLAGANAELELRGT